MAGRCDGELHRAAGAWPGGGHHGHGRRAEGSPAGQRGYPRAHREFPGGLTAAAGECDGAAGDARALGMLPAVAAAERLDGALREKGAG